MDGQEKIPFLTFPLGWLTFGWDRIECIAYYFKFWNMEEKEYLTKERHKALSEELDHLKKTKRREVAEQLEYAKSLGDLSENAEYHEARDMQGIVEDRIQKLEALLKNAIIVSSHHTEVVTVGSEVRVVKSGDKNKDEKTYILVGGEESDLTTGKISTHSPFGEAIMGKKKGETFTFTTPSGPVTYKIVNIK